VTGGVSRGQLLAWTCGCVDAVEHGQAGVSGGVYAKQVSHAFKDPGTPQRHHCFLGHLFNGRAKIRSSGHHPKMSFDGWEPKACVRLR
jgi:hypothetical protein